MRTAKNVALCMAFALALWPLASQGENRASPHEQVAATLGGKKITVDYGRPYKKGRKIFGELVPWGQVWRTGADEATVMTTETDLQIGTVHVPKGSYALFTIPTEKGWTLVVNKDVKQWGAYKYDVKKDLGRAAMAPAPLAKPVEQLTIAIEGTSANEAVLKLSWDTTAMSVPLTVR